MRHWFFLLISTAVFAAPVSALLIVGPDGKPTAACGTAAIATHMSERHGTIKPARGGVGEMYDAVGSEVGSGQKLAQVARVTLQKSYAKPGSVFRIQYDTTGTNAPPMADLDSSGVPDWVELTAHVADSVLQQYYLMGYDIGLTDLGTGGDVRYDIYLRNLASQYVYGLTYSGVNGYMEVDNDFAESIYAYPGVFDSRDARGLRVTLAHEMFHSIQFLYVSYQTPWAWWMEMTATFMEEIMYSEVNDYYQYLKPDWYKDTIFQNPALGLSSYVSGSVHPYSGMVFPLFLWQKYGGAALTGIRDTFAARDLSVATVVTKLQNATGVAMRDLLTEFWVWSYYSGDRYRPQFFAEGAHYRPAPLDTVKYDSMATKVTLRRMSLLGDTTVTDTTSYLGARLVRIVPDGSAGGVIISLVGTGTYASKWALRVAVAYADVVTYMPVTKNAQTGEMSVTITGPAWQNAQDIVLVATNDVTVTSATKVPFIYRVRYLHPEAVASPPVSRFELGQNLPNPFNPATVIPFTLDQSAAVDLTVYDVQGRVVRRLVSGAVLEAGAHRVTWDGMTETGSPAGAGVYVVRLSARREMHVRRMMLLR